MTPPSASHAITTTIELTSNTMHPSLAQAFNDFVNQTLLMQSNQTGVGWSAFPTSSNFSTPYFPPIVITTHPEDNHPYPRRLSSGSYEFKDGSTLDFEPDGTWVLHESSKKKRYRGNPERAFNRYVNASDILEQFVTFAASLGIQADDIFKLPLNLFIMFLIIEAAKADKDDYERDHAQLVAQIGHIRTKKDQCGYCGRFLARARAAKRLFFCSGTHMDLAEKRAFSGLPCKG